MLFLVFSPSSFVKTMLQSTHLRLSLFPCVPMCPSNSLKVPQLGYRGPRQGTFLDSAKLPCREVVQRGVEGKCLLLLAHFPLFSSLRPGRALWRAVTNVTSCRLLCQGLLGARHRGRERVCGAVRLGHLRFTPEHLALCCFPIALTACSGLASLGKRKPPAGGALLVGHNPQTHQ